MTPLFTIVVDTREQLPLKFLPEFETITLGLPVGDYGIAGFSGWDYPDFIVERKGGGKEGLDDLCGSLGKGRERFYREIEKMRAFRFAALVIESTPREVEKEEYRSQIRAASIFGTLDALAVRTGLHIYWCGNAFGAARKVEALCRQFVRGIEKDFKRLEGGKG